MKPDHYSALASGVNERGSTRSNALIRICTTTAAPTHDYWWASQSQYCVITAVRSLRAGGGGDSASSSSAACGCSIKFRDLDVKALDISSVRVTENPNGVITLIATSSSFIPATCEEVI